MESLRKIDLEETDFGGNFLCNTNINDLHNTLLDIGASDVLIDGIDNDVLCVKIGTSNKRQIAAILVHMCNLQPDETAFAEGNSDIVTFWWD